MNWLVAVLALGTLFLVAATFIYAVTAKPLKTREGVILLSILANFTVVKILALILVLDIFNRSVERYGFITMILCVAFNGALVLFAVLVLQKKAHKLDQLRSMHNVH